jgi:hypothetical protein
MQSSKRANDIVRWTNELMHATTGDASAETGAWLRPFADFPGRRRVRGVQRAIACARELFLQIAALNAARRIAQADADLSREDQRNAMELIKLARETESRVEKPPHAKSKGRARSTSRGARIDPDAMMTASDASTHPSVDREEAERLREMLSRDESACCATVDQGSGVESKGVV